ncbi:hypothetical protein NQ315_000874 [Exocentrus adspersus]|uniref:Protein twisted gastrulation n=1 Tax=Exocentrus adspersus TaxID=1586481 RepID=A0AAV8WDN7_9CUCU|nr:hypothetical protein NQ315_000874 [Exocentrus adspersus]
MAMSKWLIPIGILTGAFLVLYQVETCNEAVCGSVVSKCLLTKSCNCDLKNCTCCKDCSTCLSHLYTECCSCVDMCPKPNDTAGVLSKTSRVEVFYESVPALFNVLTEQDDPHHRWNSTTFPVDVDLNQYEPKKDFKLHMRKYFVPVNVFTTLSTKVVEDAEQQVVPKQSVLTFNCTVAFWSQCMSGAKCKTSCRSMGATSYRWFHDGCCECIGQNCINFGINESRCRECPPKGEKFEELDEDELDYGEDDVDYTDDTDDNEDNEMSPL